ncbi:hypothetical protein BC829DRAFT_442614 [Chytridium lagenaria]|nr:hypothetical protein BC829DRAFT_442614 [Chytridium lagenaria]
MSSTPTQDVPSPSGVNSPIITSAAAAVTKVAKDPLIRTSKAKGANFSLAKSKAAIVNANGTLYEIGSCPSGTLPASSRPTSHRNEANEVLKILEKDADLLPIIENMLPVSEREWNEVAAEFNDGLPIEDHHSAELIKSHFDSLHSVRKLTGDPDCPANVQW